MATRKKGNKADTPSQVPDRLRWFAAIVILISAIGGFYYWSEQMALLRLIGLLIAFGIAGAIIFQTAQGKLAWNAVKEARMEMRKVVWPTRKETIQTTMVVISVVLVVAIILWVLDGLLGFIMRYLLGQGG
uniref:Protein translocase subunit SecE n=1 Tax=Candidatus Kentrum sp. MB TaxID=2138164 RepID=A0A451B8A4_9GAMM|nr:MAG: protein translocase subunit secE/sec61 gamma [Candidatus Kentron sp. MB]VFK26586.1 MAG: protein translocase subunit secE/sec61 gamma [Candidatus Kentron sp. MB]VFK74533.1 MAG: protein translocase subunit secE/sec61 gamma [Candidatus Kentron sp. MB]